MHCHSAAIEYIFSPPLTLTWRVSYTFWFPISQLPVACIEGVARPCGPTICVGVVPGGVLGPRTGVRNSRRIRKKCHRRRKKTEKKKRSRRTQSGCELEFDWVGELLSRGRLEGCEMSDVVPGTVKHSTGSTEDWAGLQGFCKYSGHCKQVSSVAQVLSGWYKRENQIRTTNYLRVV